MNDSQTRLNKILLEFSSEQQSIVSTLDPSKSKVNRLQVKFVKMSQKCDALKQCNFRQVL